ncbi:MAG: DUF4227 family protein [Planifilum sp.]|jgi:hypothetical protein
MVVSVRRLVEWIKFLLLFVLFTVLMYQVFALFSDWLEPRYPYREPAGRAVKVFSPSPPPTHPESVDIGERLLLFYHLGE